CGLGADVDQVIHEVVDPAEPQALTSRRCGRVRGHDGPLSRRVLPDLAWTIARDNRLEDISSRLSRARIVVCLSMYSEDSSAIRQAGFDIIYHFFSTSILNRG